VVATQELRDLKVSLGIGFGKFVGDDDIQNPLSLLSKEFDFRPNRSKNFDKGGTPSYDKWFRGDATMFGGVEYFFSNLKGLSIKLEYDPYDYSDFSARNRKDALDSLRKKDSDINIGFSLPYNKYLTIDASYIKGNTFNLSFNVGATFNGRLRKNKDFKPNITKVSENSNNEMAFYEDLLHNLNTNNLLMQTASLSDNKLDVSISTSQHRNAIRSSSYAGFIAHEVFLKHDIDVSQINISHINAGIELNNISYILKHLDKNSNVPVEIVQKYTALDSGNKENYKKHAFKPSISFPVIFSSLKPALVAHIGNPEKFYFGGIDLQHNTEIQFSRNLLFTSQINIRLDDNFKNTISGPGSKMEHVRTDLVDYLKEDDMHIKRMQLDYIWSPYKDFYTKISGGIYETMFGGIGIEALYKPFSKKYNIGFELFHVKQRAFEQKFNFQDYSTTTGHINFSYKFIAGIESNISYGRYLAKDDGFTFDLSRTTNSGFKAGIYFTRTDVPAELFGEGSFDKGFYFQIPMDLITGRYQGEYFSFKLSPLTRDGGAKLIHDKDLRGLIYNTTHYELNRQWKGFSN